MAHLDEKGWKGDPVFEKKLFYRAENVVYSRQDECLDSTDEMSDDSGNEMDPCASLDDYKTDKIDQIKQYMSELSMLIPDPEEAQQQFHNTKNKIQRSESKADVDEAVELFYCDLTQRQIVG